jgi:hypothetical protein
MENNSDNKERIEINIDNTDSAIGWLERMLALLKEYGPFKIIGATVLIVIVSSFLYFMFNISKAFEIYDEWRARCHDEKMELRMEMGPKIQSITDKLTYSTNASRTLVLELHNGNTGNGGLPFTKCTATYESLNIGKYPVSSQYQDVNMSLIPFTSKLFKEGYWCGNTDDLEPIDRALFYKIKSNGIEHFSACSIEGIGGKIIAFMIVSFDEKIEELNNHNCAETKKMLKHCAMELAVILEVTRLIENGKH